MKEFLNKILKKIPSENSKCDLQTFIQKTINMEDLEDISINEDRLRKQLKDIKQVEIKNNPKKVIFLDGPWGIGKSYYVKNILETKLKLDSKYIPIRISLFGLKSIDELKDKLLNEYIKERNEKISKYFKFKYIGTKVCFIVSLFWIFCNYYMNGFCKINSTAFSYIFQLFTNQCNSDTPNYIKVIGDVLEYFHFIPEIYIYLFLFSTLPITQNILSYIDHKYFGTSFALQKVEINKLFSPKKYILIFDDIERISDEFNIQELFGFLNDLRENKGFNIVVIGDEIKLKEKELYIDCKEKMEFQIIPFEYTQRRYKNIKNYCLKERNIDNLSEKIDHYLYRNLPQKDIKINMETNYCIECFSTDKDNMTDNLRIIKKLIETFININEELKKLIIINDDDIDKLSNCKNNIVFVKSKIENFINYLFDSAIRKEKELDSSSDVNDDIIRLLPTIDSNVIKGLGITKLRALLNISINNKNKEYKSKYIDMLYGQKENVDSKYIESYFEKLSLLLENIEENNEDEINIKKIINYLVNKYFYDITVKFIDIIQNKELLSSNVCSFNTMSQIKLTNKFLIFIKQSYDEAILTHNHDDEITKLDLKIYFKLQDYIQQLKSKK